MHAKFDDALSGVVHWAAVLDGEDIEKEHWHSGWTPGDHRAGGKVMDRVGNHAMIDPVPFYFDDSAPTIDWRIENEAGEGCDDAPVYDPPVRLALSASDNRAGVASFESSLDGTVWTAAESSIVVDGEELHLRSGDAVGNGREVHATWAIDRLPPSISLTAPDGETYPAGSDIEEKIPTVEGDVLQIVIEDDGCTVPIVSYRYEDGRYFQGEGREIPIRRELCFVRPFQRRYCRIVVEAEDQFGRRSRGSWRFLVAKEPGE